MRPGTRSERAICPTCGMVCALTIAGDLRRHPPGQEDLCPGSGKPPTPPAPELDHTAPVTSDTDPPPLDAPPPRLAPGIYRPTEPMLAPSDPCPPGHVTVAIVMHVPYDGSNGRTPAREAAMLYEDPAYLQRVMDAVPNTAIRLSLKVDNATTQGAALPA